MRGFVHVNCSRETIDPEGIGSDQDYQSAVAYILDAIRTAYPDLDVRRMGSGSRTGGVDADGDDITDDVRAAVERAWAEWLDLPPAGGES